ncbi:hypothetical protein GEMRC1_013677 [Eukaryota sp. GEM-RC1]
MSRSNLRNDPAIQLSRPEEEVVEIEVARKPRPRLLTDYFERKSCSTVVDVDSDTDILQQVPAQSRSDIVSRIQVPSAQPQTEERPNVYAT